MKTLLLVGAGRFFGGILRYGGGLIIGKFSGTSSFPWHTLLINLSGCFLLGLLNGYFVRGWAHHDLRLALTAGLCGGFTTFSTFSQESMSMLRSGAWLCGGSYIAVSVLVGLLCFAAGWYLGERCC